MPMGGRQYIIHSVLKKPRNQLLQWVNHAEEAYANELLRNQHLEMSQMKNSPIMA